ncbi:MAG: adenine deaminase [Synergistaceae bacterium]|nr:adenine deaminase C-terminal domain-containing protein [Synergistota bacterium]NLM71542.1 adenine deaminase [Synergistaceae bacterium]
MNIDSLLAVARGDSPADLVLRGSLVANVFTLEYEKVDVAIYGGRIAGVGHGYDGRDEQDLSGLVLAPGFLDGHCHIESTMLTPAGFSELTSVRGTSAAAADPHEIANTCGMAGVEYMWRESLDCPVDILFTAPSCVPASPFETPLEPLDAEAIAEMFERGMCDSLGEVMNYPGVIHGDAALWAKLYASGRRPRSGHAPGLSGKELCAYLLSGCDSDHESFAIDEGREKLRRGMWLMIREGATEKNLAELAKLVKEDPARSSRCMMVSDDLTARYLRDFGHMDEKMRLSTRLGIPPLIALRMITLSTAEYFGWRDRGAIAPGRRADLVAVDSLENCNALKVWKDGELVAEEGRLLAGQLPRAKPPVVRTKPVSVPPGESFRVEVPSGARIRAIGVKRGQVVTEHLLIEPTVRDGLAVADPSRDLAYLAVLEKNQGTGRLAVGFVRGLGLKEGAICSSVAHDAHNFVAAGMDIASIRRAFAFLVEQGGGIAAVRGENVLSSLSLPVGGLMNPSPADEVIDSFEKVERAAAGLGTDLEHPFMAMSFLSLSVIPELKLTDQGYVDLGRGGLQSMFIE